jgi:nucleoid-associated protein YgaU
VKRFFIIGLLGVVLVVAGIIWAWQQFTPETPSAAAPASAAAPRVATAPAKGGLSAPPISTPSRPSFDVVRINPAGDAVLAGRAEPNSLVIIQDGEREVGRVQADPRGEWVFVPNQPLPPGTRELSLTAQAADGAQQTSEQVVVLAVPERGKDLAGRPVSEPAPPLAMATPREGLGRSTVLQLPTATRTVDGRLSLDVIDYDDKGPLVLAGRGAPGATVTVYLDNRPVGRAVVGSDGTWTLTPDLPVSPGKYIVRVDQLGADGRVVARIEMPFTRGEATPQLASGATQVIVQPGNSLWRIARRTYGEGIRFTLVYDANKDQIRDPDLIYPGQLFVLPKTN